MVSIGHFFCVRYRGIAGQSRPYIPHSLVICGRSNDILLVHLEGHRLSRIRATASGVSETHTILQIFLSNYVPMVGTNIAMDDRPGHFDAEGWFRFHIVWLDAEHSTMLFCSPCWIAWGRKEHFVETAG